MTPGEKLFKDVMSDEDEYYEDRKKNKFKPYTLCMICNPATCGYDLAFSHWKDTGRSGQEKAKKIVVNSNSY